MLEDVHSSAKFKALLKRPCRLIVVGNHYSTIVKTIAANFKSDGFSVDVVETTSAPNNQSIVTLAVPSTAIGKALQVVKCVMAKKYSIVFIAVTCIQKVQDVSIILSSLYAILRCMNV